MPYTIVLLVCLVGTEPPCPAPEASAGALAPSRSTAFDPTQVPDSDRAAARPGLPAERWRLRPGEDA